jgi:hypothetical protein
MTIEDSDGRHVVVGSEILVEVVQRRRADA